MLGLGIAPPQSSWGMMANAAIQVFQMYPTQLIVVSLFICVTMLSFNLLGRPAPRRIRSEIKEVRKWENENILKIDNLHVSFDTYAGEVHAVRGVSLEVKKGEVMAIVGESGCGKSVTAQTIMKLNPMLPPVSRREALICAAKIS